MSDTDVLVRPQAAQGGGGFDLRTVDHLLTTTRSVRKRLDLARPVELSVISECLALAGQAPSADNQQNWRWLVITDRKRRKDIGEIYKYAWGVHKIAATTSRRRRYSRDPKADAKREAARRRNTDSGQWLADHIAEVPVLVIPCMIGRPPADAMAMRVESVWTRDFDKVLVGAPGRLSERTPVARTEPTPLWGATYWGSVFPAIWSFQLALRSRGLGSAITTTHLPLEADVNEMLGIPRVATQVCLMPVAYTKGRRFRPSARRPVREVTYLDHWEGEWPADGEEPPD